MPARLAAAAFPSGDSCSLPQRLSFLSFKICPCWTHPPFLLLPKRSWKAGVLGLGAALGLGVQLTCVCVQHPKLAQYNPAGSSYDGPPRALPVLKPALCFSQPQLGFLKPTQVGRPRGDPGWAAGPCCGTGAEVSCCRGCGLSHPRPAMPQCQLRPRR